MTSMFFHEQECTFPDPHPPHLWGEITFTEEEEADLLRQFNEKKFGGSPEHKRKAWGTRRTYSCSGKAEPPVYDIGFLSFPQEVQDQVNEHAAKQHEKELPLGHRYVGNLCSGFGAEVKCEHYDPETLQQCGKSPGAHEWIPRFLRQPATDEDDNDPTYEDDYKQGGS